MKRPTRSYLRMTVFATLLAACTSLPKTPAPAKAVTPDTALGSAEAITSDKPAAPPTVASAPCSCPEPAEQKGGAAPITWASSLRPVPWEALPGWAEDRVGEAFAAFLQGCAALRTQRAWQPVCDGAASVARGDEEAVRRFFESGFTPYEVVNPDGSTEGTITGYYEPLLRGSRSPTDAYRFPIYGVPDDLLVVDLSELYPELKPMRLRGRVEGRRIVPYYSRAEIDAGKGRLAGRELLWTDDAIDLFFMQIQGSGKVVLDSGETVRLSYSDQNGHPYRSIGRLLVERGELTLDQASLQGIRAWGVRNPERLQALLDENASYVFFRELPATEDNPPGSLGVPLSAGRSLAVDPRAIPLGAPVLLATTWPSSDKTLNRLMVAQDTGGAIKGAVRADFYWGSGESAGLQAGRMRQRGRLWVLLPNGFALSQDPARR